MLRYENVANVGITVNLHNGYNVLALSKWDKESQIYLMTWYISRNDTYCYDLIQQMENIKVKSDMRTIKSDMANSITAKLHEGFFDYYIKRYEYQDKCFKYGNALFEGQDD